jgi:hypothetical protein
MEKSQYKELVMPDTPQTDDNREDIAEINTVPDDVDLNKRSSRRNRTLIAAEIRFNKNFASVKCIIRNLSDTGALLKITDTNAVPNCFTLQIPMHGYEVECQIIDQAGHQFRVEFTSEKRKLSSKKIQYIDATSTISGGAIDTQESDEYQRPQINSAAKSTNNLISSFRQQKIEAK